MSDFAEFRQKANAAFSDLNLSLMMFEMQGATSSGQLYYRIKAQGMNIGPEPLTAQGTSAESAIANLVRLVAQARKARRKAHDQNGLLARAA